VFGTLGIILFRTYCLWDIDRYLLDWFNNKSQDVPSSLLCVGSLAWQGARCTKWYHMLLESFLTAYEVPCEGRGECQESCSLFWFCKLELSNFRFPKCWTLRQF